MTHESEALIASTSRDFKTADIATRKKKQAVLADALIGLDFRAVSTLFAEHKTASPSILWSPSRYDILHPLIKRFAEFMWSKGATLKSKEDLLFEFKSQPFGPWTMILEPVCGRSDFKYLKYGAEIAALFGQDLTGHCTSKIGGHISEFFIALYSAVLERKQCVLSVHVPPAGVFATVWRRMIFPIFDHAGKVHLIAAITVPDNELCAGLEALPDPSLVANADGSLMYANAAARRVFGEPTLPRKPVSEYCAIEINLPASVENCAKAQSMEISQAIGTREQILVHFELRTSATFFRNTAYFVVQLKPS